jgi:hypothetical protein
MNGEFINLNRIYTQYVEDFTGAIRNSIILFTNSYLQNNIQSVHSCIRNYSHCLYSMYTVKTNREAVVGFLN